VPSLKKFSITLKKTFKMNPKKTIDLTGIYGIKPEIQKEISQNGETMNRIEKLWGIKFSTITQYFKPQIIERGNTFVLERKQIFLLMALYATTDVAQLYEVEPWKREELNLSFKFFVENHPIISEIFKTATYEKGK
jgi:hypothetical protein